MVRRLCAAALVSVGVLTPAIGARAAAPDVAELRIEGVINVFSADYIVAGIATAEHERDGAILVTMDTPGGIDSSMRRIIQAILATDLPVIVFVSPSGARAASAGLYISQAADLLAMAPGTNIGSAHPVFLSTGSGQPGPNDVEGQKVLNDSVAYIQGLAALHGRNADWAADAVRNSVNVPAETAVQLHVADLVSADTTRLFKDSEGRQLTKHGHALTLHTAGATVHSRDIGFIAGLLHTLADPQIAYLLMLLALLGIGVEITHPGAIAPGVVGAISGVLALVAFESLPVSYAGLALVGLAVVLFVADIKAPTHGVLTLGGILSLLLGSFLVLDANSPYLEPNLLLVVLPPLLVGGLLAFVISKAVAARRRTPTTGIQRLVGAVGEVRQDLDQTGGSVFVDGALWQAHARQPVARGARVRVVAVEGLRLEVEPAT